MCGAVTTSVSHIVAGDIAAHHLRQRAAPVVAFHVRVTQNVSLAVVPGSSQLGQASSGVMRTLSAVLVATAVFTTGTACSSHGASLSATYVDPDPRTGALFIADTDVHTCSGSVLHSQQGDLVLTAAHCVAGGVEASFVPGLAADTDAQSAWRVDAVYLDPRWIRDRDPRADFAIVRVSRGDGARIESTVGSGFTLAAAPEPGTTVAVTGYAFGEGVAPIGCTAPTQRTDDGYAVLECDGMVAGTSGSPWVSGTSVTGVTGGRDGGGCDDDVSYAAPFDHHVFALMQRAEAGGPGDEAVDVEDDC